MNSTSKKLTALFLVFSLLTINCFPKRRGINLNVTKADGQPIKGELIAVKENSLLLLEKEAGVDVSINISDVKIITVKGLTTGMRLAAPIALAAAGSIAGLAVWLGVSLFGLLYITAEEGKMEQDRKNAIKYGAFILGSLGLVVAITATDKTIQIEGMTDLEIQETLNKLRKKARVRDYR
jgi:hypothetical protein